MEGRTKTPYQIVLINRLTKVANNAVVQGARPINVIGIGSNEDGRNLGPGVDEVSAELDSAHRRHMDISDQAGRFDETRRRQEIARGGETFDGVPQGPYEPSHGLAKEPIILND